MWIRRVDEIGKGKLARWEKRVSEVEKESVWGGKEEWVRWKGRVGEVGEESGRGGKEE